MAIWATVEEARRLWADAPDDDALLQDLLESAQEVAEAYAPALATSDPVPSRYRQAVVLQAREHWQAVERDGDVLGFGGEFAIRVRPLGASVKALLRPRTGAPVLWPSSDEDEGES